MEELDECWAEDVEAFFRDIEEEEKEERLLVDTPIVVKEETQRSPMRKRKREANEARAKQHQPPRLEIKRAKASEDDDRDPHAPRVEGGPWLSDEQLEPVEAAVKKRRSVFITGGAGTGKSVVMREIAHRLREDDTEIYLAASTGNAAVAIGGTTLHYAIRMGDCREDVKELMQKARSRNNNNPVKKMWRDLRVLIVDEVSMFDAEFFDKAERIIAAYRGMEHLPFGGLQVVFVGDFFQLPPVLKGNERPLRESTGKPIYCAETWAWATLMNNQHGPMQVFQLQQVHRQHGDAAFVETLANVRIGRPTAKDCERFETRVIGSKNYVPLPEEDTEQDTYVRLCPKNVGPKGADIINRTKLNSLASREYAYGAMFTRHMVEKNRNAPGGKVYRNPPERLSEDQERTFKNLETALRKDCSAENVVKLKKGARVVLMANVDFEAKLVNGTPGVVVGFHADGKSETSTERPPDPIVLFKGNSEPVRVRWHAWPMQDATKKMEGRLWQVPLRLAWAMTVHRVQGMTLEKVEGQISEVFEYGQAYVMLSRTKTLAGLHLHDFDVNKIRADPRVLAFHQAGYKPQRCLPASKQSSTNNKAPLPATAFVNI